MKRGIMILIFISIFIVLVVAAPAVTLTSPSNGASQSSSIVSFQCSADYAENISLYTNTSGAWQLITTSTGTSLSHSISSVSSGNYIWNCKATNQSESSFYTSNYTFSVSSSTPPSFSGVIANQSWDEDTTRSNAFDLDTYFTDTDSLTFGATGNSSINITIATDNQVSFTPAANFSGNETIRFSASDGTSTNYSNYLLLTIVNINDAPYLSSNITNISINKNENTSIVLTNYFSDIDSTNLTFTSTTPSHISITINGSTAKIVPNTDWTGNETIRFSASDGTYTAISNNVTITVTSSSSSNSPIIDSYSPTSDPTISPNQEQDFSVTVSDPNNDDLTVKWYLDSSEVNTGNEYTFMSESIGDFSVKAEVSDGTNTATKTWQVTVTNATLYEQIDENVNTDSIITKGVSSSLCGNGLVEEGENCLNCKEDVACEKGFVCKEGVCNKKNNFKTVIIFVLVVIGIIASSILVYYFSVLKKPKGKQENLNTSFKFKQAGEQPPSDYTDFYKSKK